MPELPEVETIKLQLEKFLVGDVIKNIEIRNQKIISGDIDKIVGSRITSVRRFTKALSIDLNNGFSILIHVKLTGQLIYEGERLKTKHPLSKKIIGGVPGPHTHIIFEMESGLLYYNDVRKFGWIKILKTSNLKDSNEFLKKLGPEPFKDLTFDYFSNLLSKSKRNIKAILMDQSKIGGMGNIYANDALWLAKINPKRVASTLDSTEQKRLYKAVHTVLKTGFKYKGASELAYVTPDGGEGEYQKHTLVYGRQGELCKRKTCEKKGAKIMKIFLSGRGTYFCPNCQK